MNLTKYWGWQAELDLNILETHNLVENEELLQKKILALNVELGELANEWRGFKFWSNKPTASKEKILGEYVDCLHFAFSIGNQLSYKEDYFSIYFENDLLNSFEQCFICASELTYDRSKESYNRLLYSLVELGFYLGFENTEIEEAYLSKNETNHKRQEDGY